MRPVLVYGHPILAPAALDAVRKWKFRPYLLQGHPVEVEGEVELNVP
jgi:protein TonB